MSPDASWSFAPGVAIALVLGAAVYVVRWRRSRAPGEPHPPSGWRLAAFTGGLAVVAVALVSPVDSLAEQLLVMHMVQHVLLLDIAPILLILGLTKVLLRPATRRLRAVEERAGFLAGPVFAVVLYSAGMWAWHVPAMYDLAARHEAVHVLEHLTFSTIGLVYWWHLLSPIRSRLRRDGMAPLAYMVATKASVGLLGIVLTFAPSELYPYYAHQPHWWGLGPHADQALAGVVMALEQSLVMGVALVVLFSRMLTESERRQQRAERLEEAAA
jgi:cytochrome c oxidase assembly factor CtaG